MLPGAKAVLFTSNTVAGNFENADIVVYSMTSGQRKTVQRGGAHPRYAPSGHLVYMHEGTLFAMPFDLKRLEVTGQPTPVLEGVVGNAASGGTQFSFSETGNLAYVAGRSSGYSKRSIYWMDREGKFTPLRETPGDYRNPVFSPDGKRLAMDLYDDKGKSDIWVYELERDTFTRVTFGGEPNFGAVWTPDGRRITYTSFGKGGMYGIYWKRADGAGDALNLTESKDLKVPRSWRPDGMILTFQQLNSGTNLDIMTLTLEGDEKSGWKLGGPKPFLNSPFSERNPAFSPDGRWLAYESDESGESEVYVRPFPSPGGKWQVSTGGGNFPKWSRSGNELFYRTADNRIMAATYVASGDSFRADKPRLWSPGQFTGLGLSYNFDPHPDGKRFAVLKAPGTGEAPKVDRVSFIFNFFDELRRKVPFGKN